MEIISRKAAKAAGLKLYFTGKPCVYGHIAERRTSCGYCRACEIQYKAENKDRLRKQHTERSRVWRSKNREVTRQSAKRYRKRHPERVKKLWERWSENNPEKRLAIKRRCKANRYESHLAECRNRRARKRDAPGKHTAKDIEALAAAQGHACRYCKTPITRKSRQIDHRQPLVRGGSNGPENLQLLCAPCNRAKWAFDPDEFERRIGVQP